MADALLYQCLNCSKPVKLDLKTARKIQCPFCGHRILIKPRPSVLKKVVAR